MTRENYTSKQLKEIEAALATAKEAQEAYWDALRDLEHAVGSHDLDLDDLSTYEVDDILTLVESNDEEEKE